MSETLIIGISTLIIGWILGLLSNIINVKLNRRSNKKDILNGIKSEVSELQIHLTSVSLMSHCINGEFDKEYFTWVKPYYLKSFKSVQSIFPKSIVNSSPDISELSDDQLFQLIKAAFVREPNDNRPITFTYQNISNPFLDSKINDISLLDNELQKLLLNLKRDINFLNNDINQIWFFNSKTYDEPSSNNLAILNVNIKNLYGRIGRRSKIVVENIDKILNKTN